MKAILTIIFTIIVWVIIDSIVYTFIGYVWGYWEFSAYPENLKVGFSMIALCSIPPAAFTAAEIIEELYKKN